MIGLLAELVISWLLVWFLYKKNLSVLCISPTKSRLSNFAFGFIAAVICSCTYFIALSIFTHSHWIINKTFTAYAFVKSSFWTLKSVLFEELIFRGVLLYILMQKLGATTACIVSAIAFGVYHWFVTGALGHPAQMLIVFFMTGLWGLMFAFAFVKTKSLYLPVALHFGWNLVNIVIFSKGPLGNQFLMSSSDLQQKGIFMVMVVFILQVFLLPAFTYFYLNRQAKKEISL